jgi:hypothetical protein
MRTFSCILLLFCLIGVSRTTFGQEVVVKSPDERLKVTFVMDRGRPFYFVTYEGKTMLGRSALGLVTSGGDFSERLVYIKSEKAAIDKKYTQDRIKKSEVHYQADKLTVTLENNEKKRIQIIFQVSNNDVAFRYELPAWGDRMSCVVNREVTAYNFPSSTTTFLSSNLASMGGWARTHPSYESGYAVDAPVSKPSDYGKGFVFPALFKVADAGWMLLSETGVSSLYCASHLSEYQGGSYTIEYPDADQNNGFGSSGALLSLPGVTPWRTITVGNSLKPVVETTIPFDVVEPLYAASRPYKFGKATWSWILWQDESMNAEDQKKYIDLAATLGYEYILIDALWDERIGKDRMADLIKYAGSKKVEVLLWYNSNGASNDAPQGPRNKLNSSIERKKEMKWLQDTGVKGLKIDFFGGDKQETMRYYEDILSDANDYGLMIEFHGATLPRGWERMYPNYTGSEAVQSSEMLVFYEDVRKLEAVNATLHPFIRNTVGSMDFGAVLLNKYLTRSNSEHKKRLTTDGFQLATAVLFQNPVQPFALAPNNLTDVPAFEINFMKSVPTTWDETLFIDGYPGKYAVIARRHGSQWFIAGVNAQKDAFKLRVKLPVLSGRKAVLYNDDLKRTTFLKAITITKSGEAEVCIQPGGGFVLQVPAN